MKRQESDTAPASTDAIEITSGLSIPRSEIEFRFSRSGGKGGQNVNKVETKVELLFDVARASSLNDDQRRLLLAKLGQRVDAEGVLHIVAQTSRSQWKNREEAVHKFTEALQKALKPTRKRVKTKASRASKEKRLQTKKRRGEIKKLRGRIE